jgi:iron(II)-dependent oxidoreductase
MSNHPTATTEAAPRGWACRFFLSLTARRTPSPSPGGETRAPRPPDGASRVHGMARQLVTDERYVFVLLSEAADDIAESDATLAWKALDARMALVPTGTVPVVLTTGAEALIEVPAFYLDRCAVSNRQFQRFVDAGGYDNLEIWPQEVWPSLMKFTDRTRRPGPRDWQNGHFPVGLADHPVAGVCWHEAAAFATWSGKRLTTAAEWQKAGGWPEHLSGGSCHRYPWGDVFEPAKANLWSAGKGHTVPVDDYPVGATPNGIYQMTGNVWEWLADPLDAIPCHPDETFAAWRPMRRIIGGAFDTYFQAEGTCHFITGQVELDRRDNIGFRCALTASRLRPRD